MSKYRHKNTGIIGETNEHDNFLNFQRGNGKVVALESISMDLVENSNDWELIEGESNIEIEVGSSDEVMVIDYKILPGKRLGDIGYDDEQKENIYDYCSSHIVSTWPYAYFEWNPWNILIDGDSLYLIDWDNFQHAKRSLKKMHDLLD